MPREETLKDCLETIAQREQVMVKPSDTLWWLIGVQYGELTPQQALTLLNVWELPTSQRTSRNRTRCLFLSRGERKWCLHKLSRCRQPVAMSGEQKSSRYLKCVRSNDARVL